MTFGRRIINRSCNRDSLTWSDVVVVMSSAALAANCSMLITFNVLVMFTIHSGFEYEDANAVKGVRTHYIMHV
jgi:hypothetical protein